MKKFSYYLDKLDKVWYDSSNVVYSECDDNSDELKVVRITFKSGITYQYTDVMVNDYLMFREGSSQGQSFNKFMKHYPCEKLEGKKDMSEIESDLELCLALYNQMSIREEEGNVICYAKGIEVGQLNELTKNEIETIKKFAKIMHINIEENED